jgi:hypothetical protein
MVEPKLRGDEADAMTPGPVLSDATRSLIQFYFEVFLGCKPKHFDFHR